MGIELKRTTEFLLGASIQVVGDTAMTTCSGVRGADQLHRIKSPARISFRFTGTPELSSSYVVRGNATPAFPYAHCTSPEQSNAFGPVAPHTYGAPNFDRANATAR